MLTNAKIFNVTSVDSFKYLGRVKKGAKLSDAMITLRKTRFLGVNVKRMMYERTVMPSVLYGAETSGLKEREKKRLNVMEIKCLRSVWCNQVR